ncbi:ISKra4 family transposase [Thermopirellula anaerolimosa]
MRSVLSAEQRRQLHEKFDSVLDAMPVNVDDFEKAEQVLSEGLHGLGNQALQAWADSANTSDALPKCPCCGESMRHRGCPPCTVATTFGDVKCRRPRRRCDRCEEEWYPHDARLRFAGHGVSWPLAKVVARLMAWIPAEQVQTVLRADHRVELSKQTIQQIAHTAGEMLLAQEDAQRQAFFGLSPAEQAQRMPQSTCHAPVVAVYADGAMIHAEGEWREIRVGRVRALDGEKNTLAQKTFARFLSLEEFGRQLFLEAYRTGYGQASQRVFLGDGAHWLWELAAFHFPEAVPVLDWYHLSENVHQAAHDVFGVGTEEAKVWAKERLLELWEGGHRQARVAIAALQKQLRAPSKREALRKLGVYLKNNAERMDYPRYRAAGLPIGSGPVESACKCLVGARCKQAGMRNWRRRRAEAILRLRAALYDGRFDALWSAHLQQAA